MPSKNDIRQDCITLAMTALLQSLEKLDFTIGVDLLKNIEIPYKLQYHTAREI